MVVITGPNSVWQYSEFPEKYQLAARFLLRAAGRCSSLASCASIRDLDLSLVSVTVYWSFAVGSYFYYLIGFWKTCWYIYNPSLYFIPTPRFSVIQQCHNQWKIEVGYLDLVCRPSLLFLYVQKRLKGSRQYVNGSAYSDILEATRVEAEAWMARQTGA